MPRGQRTAPPRWWQRRDMLADPGRRSRTATNSTSVRTCVCWCTWTAACMRTWVRGQWFGPARKGNGPGSHAARCHGGLRTRAARVCIAAATQLPVLVFTRIIRCMHAGSVYAPSLARPFPSPPFPRGFSCACQQSAPGRKAAGRQPTRTAARARPAQHALLPCRQPSHRPRHLAQCGSEL